MRILMLPLLKAFRSEESGIKRVIEAYHRYAKEFDIIYTEDPDAPADLIVAHAGSYAGADVVINHGLYWTGDYDASTWEWESNADVIASIRSAIEVTVPSRWVAETFMRDMRFVPTVLGHGIEWEAWQEDAEHYPYVLWNKNRRGDVCDPTPVVKLSQKFPAVKFVTTFLPDNTPMRDNVRAIGVQPHDEMMGIVKESGIYLATTKETFGIGVLEAMAAGVPILGFAHGGNLDIVEHGVNGYLASPGDYDDLAEGLQYCAEHRFVLGENGREMARKYTWRAAVEKLRAVYDRAMDKKYGLPPKTINPMEYTA